MKEKNLYLKPSENLYVTTYEDGEVEYIPCTPDENEKEEKRLRNLGVKFTTEIRNDLIKYIDYKNRLIQREENMSIDIEKIKDEIDYHIQYMDERGQFPNVWINMIYLDENHSHIREFWNQPRFLK